LLTLLIDYPLTYGEEYNYKNPHYTIFYI